MQVDGLVGLQDAQPVTAGIAQQEVCGAESGDGRAAQVRDGPEQPRQYLTRLFVVHADGIAHHGGLGSGIPVLDAALVVGDVGA